MDYLSAVTELNYMTQIVIMLYEDNNKVRDVASALCTQFRCFFRMLTCVSVGPLLRGTFSRGVAL